MRRYAGFLYLSAVAALGLAIVSFVLGRELAATVLFIVAAAGFLAVLILQRTGR